MLTSKAVLGETLLKRQYHNTVVSNKMQNIGDKMQSMGGVLTPRTPRHRQRNSSTPGDKWGIQETSHLNGKFDTSAGTSLKQVDPENGLVLEHTIIDVPPEMKTETDLRLIELPGTTEQFHPGGSQPWDKPNTTNNDGIAETIKDVMTRYLATDSIVVVAVVPKLRDLKKFAAAKFYKKTSSCFKSESCAPFAALAFIVALALCTAWIAPKNQPRGELASHYLCVVKC